MKRTRVKAKEINKLLDLNLSKKDIVEVIQDSFKVIVINGVASFFYLDDKVLPTLKYLQQHDALKKITVDMGAIKFVVNGADIMRPGITKIEDGFVEGDYIVVIDENNKKALCVGRALMSSADMKGCSTGKVIKNIHFVGDELWNDY